MLIIFVLTAGVYGHLSKKILMLGKLSKVIFMDGETYQKLIKQVKEELDIDLNVCLLEQVRRRKK
jgi:hypothetical protein